MAAASAHKPGVKGGVYRNTGTYGSPTWTEMLLVIEANPNIGWDFFEAGERSTLAKLYMKTRMDLGAAIKMRADDADAGFVAMVDAAIASGTKVDLLIINGKITTEGARGIRSEFLVNQTGEPQPIDGGVVTDFEIKPTYSSNGVPKTVVMGSGSAPTFASVA